MFVEHRKPREHVLVQHPHLRAGLVVQFAHLLPEFRTGGRKLATHLDSELRKLRLKARDAVIETPDSLIETPDSLIKLPDTVIKTADGPTGSCHLLYVSGFDAKRSDELLFALTGAPIFTISDEVRFAEKGGVAQLIVENGRVRFAINMDAARRARLKISSKLLSLATIIKDPTDAQR